MGDVSPGSLPLYRDLPPSGLPGYRSAWGLFGENDQLGRLNLLTPDVIAAAAAEIRTGVVHSLSLPPELPDPPWGGGRQVFEHRMWSENRNTQDDLLDTYYLQSSSQWDGFRHISAGRLGFYGGVSAHDAGPDGDLLGIQAWAERGIVGRGVLADVIGHFRRTGRPFDPTQSIEITRSDIEQTLSECGVELRVGDILLVRTGYVDAYLAAPAADRRTWSQSTSIAGLSGGEELAEYLWDSGVSAVAVDNPAVEVIPGDAVTGSFHRRMLALLGMPLGELFDLRSLAAQCEGSGRYSFFFTAAPLGVRGGVGSPANALATC